MTATPSIDMSAWLHEQLAQASPDLLRAMVSSLRRRPSDKTGFAELSAPRRVPRPSGRGRRPIMSTVPSGSASGTSLG
jgi:hypothetical protein